MDFRSVCFWEGGQQCVFVEGTCLWSYQLNGCLSGSFALAGTHPTAGSRHLAVHPHHFSLKDILGTLCFQFFSFVTFVHSSYRFFCGSSDCTSLRASVRADYST